MRQRPFPTRCRRPARGLSLLEVMVALVLGLLVLAAVFLSSAGMVTASRQQRAASLMADDALLALSLIRRDLLMAGYVHPASISGGQFAAENGLLPQRPVFGCLAGFVSAEAPVAQGTCQPATAARADALEINYEATAASVDLSAQGRLTGCQGAELKDAQGQVPATAVDASTRLTTSHRYYVASGQLLCASAASQAQALVPNVEALRVSYGVSPGWQADQPDTRRPVRYANAADVGNAWNNVVAIHLCVLMRSAEAVLDKKEQATQAYTDCEGQAQSAADGFQRRAFATTVALRNRVAP